MTRMLFVNLAVEDLPRAKEFWGALGFAFDEQYTNEDAACMVVSDVARIMLLTHPTFTRFTQRSIADTTAVTEGLFAISCESREAVDAMVGLALANGGRPAMPVQDHGFMYGWSFYCPDGHHWEPFWMDSAVPDGEDDDEGDDL
jgi:uncharacterized protein